MCTNNCLIFPHSCCTDRRTSIVVKSNFFVPPELVGTKIWQRKTPKWGQISNRDKLHKSPISPKCFLFLSFNRCYWVFHDISMIYLWFTSYLHDISYVFFCILYKCGDGRRSDDSAWFSYNVHIFWRWRYIYHLHLGVF